MAEEVDVAVIAGGIFVGTDTLRQRCHFKIGQIYLYEEVVAVGFCSFSAPFAEEFPLAERGIVGVELTPYPRIFVPLDDWLSRKMGVSSLMGRCKGQDGASVLTMQDGTALGCAVCYESIYGEYCTGYVNAGAEAMAVITNDAWWGDTPGYKQHLNYSRLRAIELRRDFARCGNTGISCFIDQKGDIVSKTDWWKSQTLRGSINFNTGKTFFVRNGDIVGRVSTLMFFLLSVLLLIRVLMRKKLS